MELAYCQDKELPRHPGMEDVAQPSGQEDETQAVGERERQADFCNSKVYVRSIYVAEIAKKEPELTDDLLNQRMAQM